MKRRVYQIIEKAEEGDRASKVFDNVILTLIVCTIFAIILESYYGLYLEFQKEFKAFEVFSIVVFAVEYVLRVWTSDLKYPDRSKPVA